ncbi:hypothetical protein T02_14383 [Trichinella nativa]|uniref:Uncharacterized protein n=1 Tax=Trichinella nativa TaxID=6335 RepID=A0A0V1KHG3_9BILA|nr:hypothetical protein T02_14383 [Trichinella nativa]
MKNYAGGFREDKVVEKRWCRAMEVREIKHQFML